MVNPSIQLLIDHGSYYVQLKKIVDRKETAIPSLTPIPPLIVYTPHGSEIHLVGHHSRLSWFYQTPPPFEL